MIFSNIECNESLYIMKYKRTFWLSSNAILTEMDELSMGITSIFNCHYVLMVSENMKVTGNL